MIRVNLVRNRVGDATATGPGMGSGGGGGRSSNVDDIRDIAIKIVPIAIFTLGLMVWESNTIRALNEEQAKTAAMIGELEAQNQVKATEVEAIKDVAHQAQELEDKLKVLKLLSKLRLREVKTLDFMQSSIPEKVWLRDIHYETDKEIREENVERGRYRFEGNSVTTEDLSEFVKRMEDSAYLNEVIVIKNQESTGPGKSGGLRDFQFTADVEVKN